MRHSRLLAGAGLLALLVSLVAQVPARVAVQLSGLPATAVTGITGTVWRGSAQQVSLGELSLGPLSWQVRPSRLLLGRLAADIVGTLPDGFVKANLALSPGGHLTLRDLEAAAPLAWLAPAAGRDGSQLTARFERLVVSESRVETAIGTLQVAGVVLPIATAGSPLAPGNYTVAFDTADLAPDQPLTGTVTDAGGPLAIAGTVTITPPRSYELVGTAKPRPDAPPELRDALKMLGPATADGGHALSVAGSF